MRNEIETKSSFNINTKMEAALFWEQLMIKVEVLLRADHITNNIKLCQDTEKSYMENQSNFFRILLQEKMITRTEYQEIHGIMQSLFNNLKEVPLVRQFYSRIRNFLS